MSDRPLDPEVGQQINVRFSDMAYGGDAIGRLDESGMAVFAWPGITGEMAQVNVTTRRTNLLRGLVTSVSDPSPLRTAPPCPYFGPCGGCQWQHINYEAQVRFKHDILRSQLERLGGLSLPEGVLRDPLASPLLFGYRNTSHFAIDPAARTLGYFTRDSHNVVPVETCPISNPGINRMIPLVNSLLATGMVGSDVPAETKGLMHVWHITVRHSEETGQTVLIFHTRSAGAARPAGRRRGRGAERAVQPERPDTGPGLEPVADNAADVALVRREVKHAIRGLSAGDTDVSQLAITAVEVMEDGTINSLGATRAAGTLATDVMADMLSGNTISGRDPRNALAGGGPPIAAWIERLGGRLYWVAPQAFFQANTGAAELLLREVVSHLPRSLSMLVDAHAGVGTFALALAQRSRKVLCIETNSSAIAAGRWTASVANAANVEFQHGVAETLLGRHKGDNPDAIVLDPPRTGCHPRLIAQILERKVPNVVYVSCDPSTLARDLKLLSASYEVTSVRAIDMFPQTFHIESVTALRYRSDTPA